MNVSQKAAARGGKYWARLCALPAFSFLMNGAGGVARVKDPGGNWVELSDVQQIVDDAETRITELEAEKTRSYQVGDLTFACVFKAAGLENMSNMQAVLDAVEAALSQVHATPLAGQAIARIRKVDEFGPCLDWIKHWVNFPAGTLLYVQPTTTQVPGNARVYSYIHQPDNVIAWRFGEACEKAKRGGDPIDLGLSLLQQLEDKGYGIVELNDPRAARDTLGRAAMAMVAEMERQDRVAANQKKGE